MSAPMFVFRLAGLLLTFGVGLALALWGMGPPCVFAFASTVLQAATMAATLAGDK